MMQITYCLSTWAKLKGLIGKKELGQEAYYVFANCAVIHTFGMRFNIDVVFCNKRGDILKYYRQLPPNRLVFVTKAFFTIEFASNHLLSAEQLKIIVENCLNIKKSAQTRYRWI
ncbi:MAG: DUF192 domain-containing protein [Alcaligenaceae bacterium]|nr:DUF192 domain-containing protein [Alcaligenaceae bacterium]